MTTDNNRPLMSTGSIPFPLKSTSKVSQNKHAHCHILIAADFSGRRSNGLENAAGISKRKIIEVDRDNFDDVFENLGVKISVPFSDVPIKFNELDDMHPDTLIENISLFDQISSIKRRLKSPDGYQKAVDELKEYRNIDLEELKGAGIQIEDKSSESIDTDNLLDSILGEASVVNISPEMNIEKFAKTLVAPFITDKASAESKELLKVADDAMSDLLRKLMHHSSFKALEATWRSLYLLTKRLETDNKLKIHIVDISKQELISDIESINSVEESQFYKLVVQNRKVENQKPFSLLLGDYLVSDNASDVSLASLFAVVGEASEASCFLAGSETIAGCQDLVNFQDKDDWSYDLDPAFSALWRELRQSGVASYLSVVSPSYLARMPFGKKGSTIDSFKFEEIPESHDAHFYLWANSSWLVVMLIAQNYTEFGWQLNGNWFHRVDKLPLHVYEDDGESAVMPCAMINMTDSVAGAFRENGLTMVRSVLNSDSVLIPAFTSVSSNDEKLLGAIQY